MSSITLGAKIPLVCSSDTLEGLLPGAPFALVEVPEFSARDHFLEIRGGRLGAAKSRRKMRPQCRLQAFNFLCVHGAEDSVGPETGNCSAYVTNSGVHGIGESFAGVAANDQPALLRHKAGHVAAVSRDDHFAALHGNAEPCRGIAMHDDGSVAQCSRRAAACVAMNSDRPAQHGLRQAPSRATFDLDRGSIAQASAVIARAAGNANSNSV